MEDITMSKKKTFAEELAELAEWLKTARKEDIDEVREQLWRQVEKDFGL